MHAEFDCAKNAASATCSRNRGKGQPAPDPIFIPRCPADRPLKSSNPASRTPLGFEQRNCRYILSLAHRCAGRKQLTDSSTLRDPATPGPQTTSSLAENYTKTRASTAGPRLLHRQDREQFQANGLIQPSSRMQKFIDARRNPIGLLLVRLQARLLCQGQEFYYQPRLYRNYYRGYVDLDGPLGCPPCRGAIFGPGNDVRRSRRPGPRACFDFAITPVFFEFPGGPPCIDFHKRTAVRKRQAPNSPSALTKAGLNNGRP